MLKNLKIVLLFIILFANFSSLFSQNTRKSIDTSYIYELPFQVGKKVYILQGYDGKYSHRGDYALDFRLRKGQSVFAAREGIVTSTEDDNKKGGPRKKFLSKGNHIIIKHSDGTYAAYWHLAHKGVKVKPGEKVQKGQLIGLSGNTGYSSWAHLHFDVYYFENGKQVTIPTKFQTSKGIEELKVYRKYKKPGESNSIIVQTNIPKNIDKIEYHFQDASVPPEYHRSYSWIITTDSIRYILNSYGTVLKDTTTNITIEKWEKCKTAFINCGIKNQKAQNENIGCTGGTGISIKTWMNGKENFSGSAYKCGGKTIGNLEGDTETFLNVIREGIDPSFYSTLR